MSQAHVIDLTQDDSDESGEKESPSVCTKYQFKPRPVTLPEPVPVSKFPTENPFDSPLINISRSIPYAFSSSNIDPFANLIRLIHQKRDGDNSLFFELTQTLASSGDARELLPSLLSLIQREFPQSSVFRHLALQSMTVLSVNNREFSQDVLNNIRDLLELSRMDQHEFLADVLSLFEVVCEFASEDQAKEIIDNFSKRDLIRFTFQKTKGGVDPIRAQVHSVFTLLAKYGNAFPPGLVYEIMKRCNYPGKGDLCKEIMWPSIVAVETFLRQPESSAYKVLCEKKDELLGKLALALTGCEKKDDVELKIMVMKVFMEACDEFRVEDLPSSLSEFHFSVTAALISMQDFAEEPVKRMAETVLHRFNM